MALVVTDLNYRELLESGTPLVLDFWAEWCGPCRMIAPVIEQLAEEYEGRVSVGKVDVDSNSDIVAEFGIRNIPTVLFLRNGQVVDKQIGAANKTVFEEKINGLL